VADPLAPMRQLLAEVCVHQASVAAWLATPKSQPPTNARFLTDAALRLRTKKLRLESILGIVLVVQDP